MKEGYAKYFENVISTRDMLTFSCENKDDVQKLFKILRTEQKLQVNIIYTKASRTVDASSPPLSEISKFGFNHFLLELVDGPIPILNYLCKTYSIHVVPVGTDHTYTVAEDIPEKYGVFFTSKLFLYNV